MLEYRLGAASLFRSSSAAILKTIGESRDLDRAFQEIYGQTYSASRRAWLARLRQLHD